MEERLGLLVHSLDELREKLGRLCRRRNRDRRVVSRPARSNKDVLGTLAGDDGLDAMIDTWIAKGGSARLLELWAKGLAFDWQRCMAQTASTPHQPADLSVRARALLDSDRPGVGGERGRHPASAPASQYLDFRYATFQFALQRRGVLPGRSRRAGRACAAGRCATGNGAPCGE
jgi:hypothetical protein